MDNFFLFIFHAEDQLMRQLMHRNNSVKLRILNVRYDVIHKKVVKNSKQQHIGKN